MKTQIIALLVSFVCIISSCAGNNPQPDIFPMPDTPTPRVMQAQLFSDAPDSLITALGLQDGIPSSVNAFLVKSNGRNIPLRWLLKKVLRFMECAFLRRTACNILPTIH